MYNQSYIKESYNNYKPAFSAKRS